jgi:hypothetical protein
MSILRVKELHLTIQVYIWQNVHNLIIEYRILYTKHWQDLETMAIKQDGTVQSV